jgi:hypothetical protein
MFDWFPDGGTAELFFMVFFVWAAVEVLNTLGIGRKHLGGVRLVPRGWLRAPGMK